jgi:signal transduction histidine kinase
MPPKPKSTQTALERQSALLKAGLEISAALELPRVLQRIVDLAAQLTGARYAALGVVEPLGGITEFVTTGLSPKERDAIGHIPVGKGILGLLIKEPRLLRLKDLHQHPRSVGFPANHPPMISFLGAPVLARGTVFGNIYITEKKGGDFTADDEESLLVLATQAGVAIENSRLYEQARTQARRLTALREITEVILEGETEVEPLLQLIASTARELVGAHVAAIATYAGGGEEELVIRVADGAYASNLVAMSVPLQDSLSGAVLKTGKSVITEDAGADRGAYRPMIEVGHMGPAAFVPLVRSGAPFGTLTVARTPGATTFAAEQVELVETFAVQASLAMEYSRLQRELRRLAVLDERERIATELHDGVIQGLFGMGLNLQATALMISDATIQGRIEDVITQLDGSIRDLRNYIFGLRPGVLADRQLQQTLKDMAREFEDAAQIRVDLAIDEAVAAELAGRASEVVQLVREAMSNVRRHSGASRAWLSLRRKGQAAVLQIRDNGGGFDTGAAVGDSHHGLRNLRRRVSTIGGSLEMSSTVGKGTTVRAVIPI